MEMIKGLIMQDIRKKDEEYKKKPRSGKWNPGKLGRCYRHQFYNRKNEPKSNPPDDKTLMLFRLGTMIHEDIQGLLPEDKVEVEVTKDDLHGFVDYVGEDFVVDFKSAGQWAFKKVSKAGYKPEENMVNLFQVVAYAYLLGLPKAFLVYVSKDNYQMVEFEIKVKHWEDELEAELSILRGFWDQDRLPPPSPRAYNGKECNYCEWADHCQQSQIQSVREL